MSDPSFIMHVDAGRVEIVSAAVNRAVDAAVEAVDTMIDLMRGAESDSIRLRAASAVLEFVGTRNGDPVGGAIRGLTTFSGSDVANLTRRLAETALEHVPVENAESFLDDLEAKAHFASRRSRCAVGHGPGAPQMTKTSRRAGVAELEIAPVALRGRCRA